jgi:hypothetical protein
MTNNAGNPELFTLNNAAPSTTAPTVDATKNIDLGNTLGVYGVAVRDNLINILTSGALLRIHNTTSNTDTDVPLPASGTTMDCQGNYLYVGDVGGHITSVTGL